MRLKKLELIGFKSFADKTAFEFEGSLTGLVGPNGSGKSNVVDGLKWVLGEQSARRLRGDEMADMIFNGSTVRKPLGCTEVRVVLKNDRGLLPVEYDEVCIARRCYRTGESEYFLNGQPCRLKDIRSLLMDTGVGVSAYSVIEQGQVDMLLRAGSKERRLVFEEAAGINRYLEQKKEAERKLERVRINLERVGDIIEELDRQLRSVRYQAAKARRYKRCSDELRKQRLALALHTYRALRQKQAQVAEAIGRQEADLRAQDDLMARLKADLSARQEALEQLRTVLTGAEERIAQIEARCYALAKEIELNEMLGGELRTRQQGLTERLASLKAQRDQLREEIAAAGKRLQDGRVALQAQRESLRQLDDTLTAVRERRLEMEQEEERQKAEVFALLQQETQVQNQIALLAAQRQMAAGRLARQHERKAQLTEQCEALQVEHGDAERKLFQVVAELHQVADQLTRLEDNISHSSTLLERLTSEIGELKAELRGKASRRQVLEDLQASAEGVGSGVKVILEAIGEESSVLAGAPGLLAAMLEVSTQDALAVEASLGPRVQAIVVSTRAQACEALRLLRDGRKGRAEVIALEGLVAPAPVTLPQARAPLVRLIDQLKYPEQVRPVVRALLENCFVVEDAQAALHLLADGLPAGVKLVTRQGECFEAGGIWSAGEPETGSLISRRSELAELEREIQELSRRVAGLAEEGDRCTRDTQELQRAKSTLLARKEEVTRTEHEIRRQLSVLATNRDRHQEELQLVESEERALADEIQQLEARLGQGSEELAALRRQREEKQGGLESLQGRLHREREEQGRLEAEKGSLTSELARRDEQHKGLQAIEERLRGERDQAEAELARLSEEQRRTLTEEHEAGERVLRAERERAALEQEKETLTAVLKEKSQASEAARAHITHLQADRDAAAARRGEIDGLLQGQRMDENETRLRVENLVDRTAEECGVRLEALELEPDQWPEHPLFTRALIAEFGSGSDGVTSESVARWYAEAQRPTGSEPQGEEEKDSAPPVVKLAEAVELRAGVLKILEAPDTDWEAVRMEAERLKKRVESMGGANLDAIREQDELEIRLQFLTNQRDDLERARRTELEIIRELSAKSRESFLATFEAVRANFQVLVRKLFGGGSGDIIMDPQCPEVLEAGIEIMVRPAGKENRSLSLLSGGEKALAAIALLFAIFQNKPSPFCLLDEVDAPLDEENVGRFIALLQEFRENTQFVIVTHNKLTMSAAESLYGISLQEDGVSKKVAVNFEEVDHRLAQMRRETEAALRRAKAG